MKRKKKVNAVMANNHLTPYDFFNCLNAQIATLSMQVQYIEVVSTISSSQICCNWCGEWDLLITQCPFNSNSFNLVGSYNQNINYPNMSNYNPGWMECLAWATTTPALIRIMSYMPIFVTNIPIHLIFPHPGHAQLNRSQQQKKW